MDASPRQFTRPDDRQPVGLVVAQVFVLVVAAVGTVAFGWVAAGLNEYLLTVNPRGGAEPGKDLDLIWLALVGWLLLTLLAAGGLPRTSIPANHADGAGGAGGGGERLWRRLGFASGAVVQFVGGLVVIGGTLLSYVVTRPYNFGGPDIPCTYASCWPLRPQALALTTPGLAAGTALLAMAVVVNRMRWWIRAVVPAATWLTLLLVQQTIWHPYVLPLLQGPPR